MGCASAILNLQCCLLCIWKSYFSSCFPQATLQWRILVRYTFIYDPCGLRMWIGHWWGTMESAELCFCKNSFSVCASMCQCRSRVANHHKLSSKLFAPIATSNANVFEVFKMIANNMTFCHSRELIHSTFAFGIWPFLSNIEFSFKCFFQKKMRWKLMLHSFWPGIVYLREAFCQ